MLDLQAALRTCRDYRRNGGSRNIGVTGAVTFHPRAVWWLSVYNRLALVHRSMSYRTTVRNKTRSSTPRIDRRWHVDCREHGRKHP